MVQPYTAVGLIPTVRGVRKRAEIERNLEHIAHMIAAASWLSSLDLPVRLVAVPEGALQGFTDKVFDLDHVTYARETAIDIPGPETRFLGDLARHWNVFIMGQAKARHEAFPDRFFNVGFAIDPKGEVVLFCSCSFLASFLASVLASVMASLIIVMPPNLMPANGR